ncbi:universal stress protein [Cribrihabitans neustonicus]|uniref:universal stress protein n=1 Tax=Cribrihabitans neustonicus TaxID=1429085 RepID=UPI003B59D8E3
MFSKIMVPVDLAHASRLDKALQAAADIAHRNNQAGLVLVGVTSALPGSLAHNPKEYGEKLDAFASDVAGRHGLTVSGHTCVSHDPAVDLDVTLLQAAKDIGADLIVMASHIPGISDYLFHAHGGRIAAQADISVLVVRGS